MDTERVNGGSAKVSVKEKSLVPHIVDREDAINKMLKENYGLRATAIRQLDGYDDLNYHVSVEAIHSNPHIDTLKPEGYFLKISNLNDSRNYDKMYATWQLMEHARLRGLPCQETVRGTGGDVFTQISSTDAEGKLVTYLVSVRTFLPGAMLADTPLSPALLYDIGVLVANTTQILEDFQVAFFDTYDHLWDLKNLPKISEILFVITDEKRRRICEDVILGFQEHVLALSSKLKTGQIHGDMNQYNILVSSSNRSGATPRICGLLDFLDTSRSFLLFELAICAAHLTMKGSPDVQTNSAFNMTWRCTDIASAAQRTRLG